MVANLFPIVYDSLDTGTSNASSLQPSLRLVALLVGGFPFSTYYNKYITNKGTKCQLILESDLRLTDGSILSVYHHWDGYPQWLGVTLNKYYPTREAIAELIDGGNMSCCYTQSGWEIEDEEQLKGLPYKPLYYTER